MITSGYTLPMIGSGPTKHGFTLIELMIALAIVGVLTTAAIPSFLRYQLRSRSSEALVNLSAIATTQEIYFAEHGVFLGVASPVPAVAPGSGRSAWTYGSAFDTLGWAPEGSVQFQYQVVADTDGAGSVRFTAEARGDVDGDGQPSFWGFVKPGPSGGLNGAFPGTTCIGSGVVAGKYTNAVDTPGPCDASSGRSVF
jgi:prepilin-type N-terminal cleavage/methylation domain-containing protein